MFVAACGSVPAPKADASTSTDDAAIDGSIDAAPEPRQVIVTVEVGSGDGSVTSNVGDIDCGQDCSAMVLDGTPITFTAVVPSGSAFMGWRGDAMSCGAMTTCVVTVSGAALNIGARFAKQGTAGWNVHVSSSGGDDSMVAGDAAGNAYLLAPHSGDITFDGTTYTGPGSILAKLSPAGDVIWKRHLPAGAQIMNIAVVQQGGDVALLGGYMAATDLGGPSPLTLPANDVGDYFVVKYAGTDGAFKWQHRVHLDDSDDPGVQGLAVNGAGDVLVAGAFNTAFNLGDGDVTTTNGDAEAFMGVLASADGALKWKKKIGGPGSAIYIHDAAFDSNGYVILGGNFSGSMNLGGTTLTPSGQDAFFASFTGTTGQFSWQRQVGGTGTDSLNALAVDVNNNVTVAVEYDVITGQNVTFAGNVLAGTGTSMDIVVGQVSSTNAYRWAKRYGGSGGAAPAGYDTPTDLAVLADGNLALIGSFYSASVTFGTTTLTNAGLSDSFIARLSPSSGDSSLAARLYGTGYDRARFVGRAGNNVVVAGRFQNQANLLGTTLTASGPYDGYAISVPLP